MSAPILALRDVSKRFVKSLDAAERMANLVGAHLEDEVVHAVDGVSLDIATGEVVGVEDLGGCDLHTRTSGVRRNSGCSQLSSRSTSVASQPVIARCTRR